MTNTVITQKIMKILARKERKSIFVSFAIILPFIFIFLIIFVLSAHKTIINLIENDFFKLIQKFEYDLDKIIPQLTKIGQGLWEEAVEGMLAFSILSLIILALLMKKGKFTNLSRRFKEIKKYLG